MLICERGFLGERNVFNGKRGGEEIWIKIGHGKKIRERLRGVLGTREVNLGFHSLLLKVVLDSPFLGRLWIDLDPKSI